MGWFAYEPTFYDMNNMNFAQSEAQSVQYFCNEMVSQTDSKVQAPEKGDTLVHAVRWSSFSFQMFQP